MSLVIFSIFWEAAPTLFLAIYMCINLYLFIKELTRHPLPSQALRAEVA